MKDHLEIINLSHKYRRSNTNRFTSPSKKGKVNNITTEIYRIVRQLSAKQAFPFTSSVQGGRRNFEIVDVEYI